MCKPYGNGYLFCLSSFFEFFLFYSGTFFYHVQSTPGVHRDLWFHQNDIQHDILRLAPDKLSLWYSLHFTASTWKIQYLPVKRWKLSGFLKKRGGFLVILACTHKTPPTWKCKNPFFFGKVTGGHQPTKKLPHDQGRRAAWGGLYLLIGIDHGRWCSLLMPWPLHWSACCYRLELPDAGLQYLLGYLTQ